jgi:VIT1/CCC1 family predicted Fe2+/Mn2+ transporter
MGVDDCPADFSEMTLCVYSRETFKPPQCNGHSLTAKEASRMPVRHLERHRTEHIGWLRAAVLGANDGILSTASLVLGVYRGEHKELMAIYVGRGLDPSLAEQVADQLMAHDAIGAHARDELGMSETLRARPIQAALASASSFAVGGAMPLFISALAPEASLSIFVSGTSLFFLALLGALAARAGGASVMPSAIRVSFWGALAMAITAGVGTLFGTVV